MKPLIIASIAAAAVTASGCAPQNLSVFVGGASALDEQCTSNSDVQLLRGVLDLGPYPTGVLPAYYGHFSLRSDLEAVATVSGDDILAGDTRNEFVATSVLISYELFAADGSPGPTVPQAKERIYFVVPPASTDGFIQFQMLSQAAGQVIAGAVPSGTDDTLLIHFQFEGNVRSDINGLIPMHTSEVTFPVRVVNRPPLACATGKTLSIVGPCGNSQDAFSYVCN